MQRLLLLSLLFFAIACKKESGEDPNAEKTQLDVSYGTDDKQKMDVYLPAGRDTVNTKLLVLIHGGAWIEGDKADFTANLNFIKENLTDYAFANINYRLYNAITGANKFPAQEEDVKAALAYLFSKRAEYRFSNKIVLLGASAGAHLALLQGYKNAGAITPKAIVSYFGPTDLAYLYNNTTLPLVTSMLPGIVGGTPAQNAAAYATSSPINYVTSKSAPTLLLQGDKDPLVPVAQANLLADKLKTTGVTYELAVYPNEVHGFTTNTMNSSILKVFRFLQANVP
jgi:acetyl esterase/lipase